MEVLNRTSDGLKRCYNVLVQPAELEIALTKKIQETAKKIRLDGFRPGKVPVDVVKRMYGAVLAHEAKNVAINDVVSRIIKDENLVISFNYATDIVKEDESGIEFTLKFELVPTIELKPTDSIKLTKYVADVTDAEIDNILESVRKERKQWIKDEDAKEVVEGHKVIADMTMVDTLKHKKATQSIELVIGDNTLVDDFWKSLVGAKIDETREFSITYPANFGDKTLAGKSVPYKATIKQILKSTEFKLDDVFAQAMGYENLEKMKAWAKSHAIARYEQMSKEVMRRQLLEQLASMYEDFEVPENMIDVEVKDVQYSIFDELKRAGREITPKILEGCRQIAIQRVRLGFVIAAIARRDKIVVSKNDINQAVRNLAMLYPGLEKKVLNMKNGGQSLNAVAGPILENKVTSMLMASIAAEEKKCSIAELKALDEEQFDFMLEEGPKAAETPSIEKNTTKKRTTKKNTETKDNNDSEAPKKKCGCKSKKKTAE